MGWQRVMDTLKSYGAAHRSIMPCEDHDTLREQSGLRCRIS